jgi:hypothetical protein
MNPKTLGIRWGTIVVDFKGLQIGQNRKSFYK